MTQPMPNRVMYALQRSLENLQARMAMLHNNIPLSGEQVARMLIRPEHYDQIKDTVHMCGLSPLTEVRFKIANDHYRVRFEPVVPVVMPSYATFFHPEAEPAHVATIKDVARRLRETYLAFGDARMVLEKLNAECKTMQDVRFYLPGILTLMSLDDATKDRTHKITSLKLPGTMIQVSPEFKEALDSANKLIAKAAMLEHRAPGMTHFSAYPYPGRTARPEWAVGCVHNSA